MGCLLVLSREAGLAIDPKGGDSLAVIVSSEVPEGKGVSSSAAVEVATMMAMAEAYGIQARSACSSIGARRIDDAHIQQIVSHPLTPFLVPQTVPLISPLTMSLFV